MAAYEVIRCDGCGSGFEWKKLFGASNYKVLRESLKKDGWHSIRVTGQPVRDVCGACWKDGKR